MALRIDLDDAIYNSLSSSGKTAYLAATIDNFFQVSEQDYLNVYSGVAKASHYGAITYEQFTGATASEFGSPFVNIDSGQIGLSADTYVIGFAMRGSRTFAGQNNYTLGVYQTTGSLSGGTYTAITSNVSFVNTVAGSRTYFIRKYPSSVASSTSYLGLYHSSNMTQLNVSTRRVYYDSNGVPPFSSGTFNPIAFITLVAPRDW